MRHTIRDDKLETYLVFADDSTTDTPYGVELKENGEVINAEWFATQTEQEYEYEELNRELSRGEWK